VESEDAVVLEDLEPKAMTPEVRGRA
jgi:hypothetical protein